MSELEHLCWGWGPQYLLAGRFDAVDPELVPVPVERAPAVIDALLHDDPTALHRLAVSMRWLEPEHGARHEGRALARRTLDELEHPAGRLSLWERPRDESLGKPAPGPELDDVVDLLDLLEEDETTWIEFRLQDQNDEPFAGLEHELEHPDGRTTSGRLSELGIVHERGIPAGSYTIRFPAAELVVLGEDGPDVGPLPPYGIERLELVGAGGARSTGWTAHDDPPAADAEPDFWLASGAETVKISYTIEDPEGRAEAATLELLVLDDDGDEQVLWRRPLTDDERAAGDHELDWDGAVDVSEALPEGFVTVLRSPYTLRLRLRGHGEADPPEASTRLWVDVAAIELELGDRTVLGRDLDRAVYDALGSLPAAGQTKEVRLVSNVFKTSSAEMNDDTLFREYDALWSRGPRIPVFATVKAKGSDGGAVLAPRALAGLPLAWEWLDVAEDTAAHHAAAKTFLDAALDFDKDLTEPAGDNCHVDRGGKRGPAAAAVLSEQAGYAPAAALAAGSFPFKVERYVERANVARSYAWTDGAVAGKTGVMFEPSRMAGDAWSLRVYPFRDLHEDGPAPGAVQASTGTFETWREVHVVKYLKKTAAIGDVAMPAFQAYYAVAKVKMEDKAGGSQTMVAADYNAKVAAAVTGQAFFIQAAVDPAVDQYAAGDHAVHFRGYAAFKTALQASQGWSAAQLAAWLAGGGSSVNTAIKYHGRCKDWAKTIAVAACDGYVHADPGVNVLHFTGLYNLESQPGGSQLNGFAPSFTSTGRSKCAFVLCPGAGNYGDDSNSAEQTLTHEIGHHMFLPHAPFPAADVPGGAQASRHDANHTHCTMGYDYSAERKFCGLCILRMRGWSADWLSSQADENTRP